MGSHKLSSSKEKEEGSGNRSSYNTIKRTPQPAISYSARITASFAMIAVMTAIIFAGVLAYVWNGQFTTYTRENLQRTADQMAETLGKQYEDADGWTTEVCDYIETAAGSMNDVGVQVMDNRDRMLYDDAHVPATDDAKSALGEDRTVTSDVYTSAGVRVGQVRLWGMGSEALFTKSDSAFQRSSYSAIILAAVLAVILAWIIGYFSSRSLTKPLRRITRTANQIRNGDLSARTDLRGTDEMGRLGETFDDMATALEKDIKLEHRLTSDVAHELRTPLMAMQATVEAMQDGVLPADQEHLATVDIEVRRLSRLVDAMLRLSRMENGKTPLRIEKCDVVGLASGLVTVQEQLFSDNGLELSFVNKTGRDELIAECDPDLIREATVNLLSNAMRYTPEGGKVELSVSRKKQDVLISVSDTGIGIAKEDIPRVFSRFWRSDASRERVAGGLGVGLSLTKEIIDRHNGTISVDSELGVGTTFTLHLPLQHKEHRSGSGK